MQKHTRRRNYQEASNLSPLPGCPTPAYLPFKCLPQLYLFPRLGRRKCRVFQAWLQYNILIYIVYRTRCPNSKLVALQFGETTVSNTNQHRDLGCHTRLRTMPGMWAGPMGMQDRSKQTNQTRRAPDSATPIIPNSLNKPPPIEWYSAFANDCQRGRQTLRRSRDNWRENITYGSFTNETKNQFIVVLRYFS